MSDTADAGAERSTLDHDASITTDSNEPPFEQRSHYRADALGNAYHVTRTAV